MRRCWIPILVVACAWSFGVRAQADIVERQLNASSGHDTRFGVYANVSADCTSGPLPAIKLVAAPAHGSVVVKRGTLKATNWRQCLATDVPVFVGFYRAAANFSGTRSKKRA